MSLTESDWQHAATLLGCDVAAIKAVADVESPGAGFLSSGEPYILFEAHIFSRLTNHFYDDSHPQISSRTWNRQLYRNSKGEHERLQQAVQLNRNAALQSASYGRFQICGFNWQRCGYASLQDFINDMYKDEAAHLKAFCGFIKSMGLADELQRKDWIGFARGYNGPQFSANNYDEKLQAAHQRYAV
jgi:hypothetical protein